MIFDDRALSLAVLLIGALMLALAVWIALLQRSAAALRARLRRVLHEGSDRSLDEILDAHFGRLEQLTGRVDALNKLQRELEEASRRSLQKVGVVRFNPFPDTGGDQSFAIALLDQNGSGIVLSSLHSRTDTRIFAKQILGGRSRYQLSDEEQDAIKKALALAEP